MERYRIYSNGKRIGPDVFYDYGHPINIVCGIDTAYYKTEIEGETCEIFPAKYQKIGDSIAIWTVSTKLSSFRSIELHKGPCGYDAEQLYDWNAYYPSREVDEKLSFAKDVENTQYPQDSRKTGWYFVFLKHRHQCSAVWVSDDFGGQIMLFICAFDFYDQFLVIDGRRIDFAKLHNLKIDYDFTKRAFSTDDKEGEIVTLELRYSFLGKNFYAKQIDTIYVEK